MPFHYLASLEQGIFFGLELRPFKCEGWSTVVYICRANDFGLRSPRDTRGGYFRGSRHAGFSQGAKQRGKIDLYPLFSRQSREKNRQYSTPTQIPPATQATTGISLPLFCERNDKGLIEGITGGEKVEEIPGLFIFKRLHL